MPYIFQNRFDIRELVERPAEVKKVIIVEPEVYACALYAYHLSAADYFVKSCVNWRQLDHHLAEFAPHLLLLNPGSAGSVAATNVLLWRVRKNYPQLVIVTVGLKNDPADIKNLMAAGVNAHLDRQLTKPQDIVAVVRSLLC